jgi:hypothetical protein
MSRRNPISTYHGTRARFSKFSARKISGRGSKAQHGWGIYLTNSDSVAASYARHDGSGGRTMNVVVDAEDEDFIDWDAPYAEQSSKIQRLLQRLAEKRDAPGRLLKSMFKDMEDGSTKPEGWDGRQFYSVLHDAFTDGGRSNDTGANKKVSLWLARGGIAGTKFPDHTDAQDGTAMNYCVFDVKKLRIEGEA